MRTSETDDLNIPERLLFLKTGQVLIAQLTTLNPQTCWGNPLPASLHTCIVYFIAHFCRLQRSIKFETFLCVCIPKP